MGGVALQHFTSPQNYAKISVPSVKEFWPVIICKFVESLRHSGSTNLGDFVELEFSPKFGAVELDMTLGSDLWEFIEV